MTDEFKQDHLPDMLPLYYKRIFPHGLLYSWLIYGDKSIFVRREISFTLIGDIYIRYLSFDTPEQFAAALHKKYPVKIDIGAIYKEIPQSRGALGVLTPIQKEIVFDIDLTDYDEIRTCCSGTDVCKKCWKFITIACKALDGALREDFGFRHVLWVFSGRRGVHCWIADEKARRADDNVRSAIAEYLQILRGGVKLKKVNLSWSTGNFHPYLKRMLSIIDGFFSEIVKEQDIFCTDEKMNVALNFVDESVRDAFGKAMRQVSSSENRWIALEKTFRTLCDQKILPNNSKNMIDELKLYYACPRLDINVTKGKTHLLKAPFCVHPKTGKICVPFNPKSADKFDPHLVPTLSQLIDEINSYDAKTLEQEKSLMESDDEGVGGPTSARIKDYKKTSLLKAINIFTEFVRGLKRERDELVAKMDF